MLHDALIVATISEGAMDDVEKSILAYFLEDPATAVSAGEISTELGIERTTLFRRLTSMGELGIVSFEGEGRMRKYRLNSNSDEYLKWDLSRPPSDRQRVMYDPGLLKNYVPNKTFLLTPEQREAMRQAAGGEKLKVAPENYRRVLNSLLIDLSYASSKLENVNISWLDTKTLIEFGERPEGLSDFQLAIVLNHKNAIQFMVENDLSFTRRDIFDLHSLLMKDLLKEPGADGRIRTKIVGFDDSRYIPLANPQQISEEFDTLLSKASQIEDPFEQSFFALLFIAYLQPFQDGNKRTSRLSTNIPLLKHRLPPFSFADIGRRDYTFGLLAFYERGRADFLAKSYSSAYMKTAQRYRELMELVQEGGILQTIVLTPNQVKFVKEAFHYKIPDGQDEEGGAEGDTPTSL